MEVGKDGCRSLQKSTAGFRFSWSLGSGDVLRRGRRCWETGSAGVPEGNEKELAHGVMESRKAPQGLGRGQSFPRCRS